MLFMNVNSHFDMNERILKRYCQRGGYKWFRAHNSFCIKTDGEDSRRRVMDDVKKMDSDSNVKHEVYLAVSCFIVIEGIFPEE